MSQPKYVWVLETRGRRHRTYQHDPLDLSRFPYHKALIAEVKACQAKVTRYTPEGCTCYNCVEGGDFPTCNA